MRAIGSVIGVRPAHTPLSPGAPADSEGRRFSASDPLRIAQCQKCCDDGWYGIAGLPIDHPQFGKAIECEVCNGGQRYAPVADLMTRARIPEDKQHLTLRTWAEEFPEHASIHRALASFAAKGMTLSGHRGLYLHGDTGVGKSGAALGVLEDMLPRATGTCRYVVWSDFLDSIRKTWNTGSDLTVGEAVGELNRVSVLVVDEFGGSGTGSGDPSWRADVARRLSDARHDGAYAGKITIWTSQLDLEGIAAEFGGKPIGDAVASRIAGHCTIVQITGRDARIPEDDDE